MSVKVKEKQAGLEKKLRLELSSAAVGRLLTHSISDLSCEETRKKKESGRRTKPL